MGPDPVPESHQGVELVIQSIARAAGRQHSKKHSQTQFALNEIRDGDRRLRPRGRHHMNPIIESSKSNRYGDLLWTEFLGDTGPPLDLQQTKAEKARNSESMQDSDELPNKL